MTVTELVAGVRSRGGLLFLEEGRVKYRGPEGLLTARLRAALSKHREAIAALLSSPPQEEPVEEWPLSVFAEPGRVLRVRSAVLGEDVYLAPDDADTASLPEGAVVYIARELPSLLGLDAETLRLVHAVKKQFGGEVTADTDDSDCQDSETSDSIA